MKTHELAKALNHLSRILRAGPNVELENLVNLSTHVGSSTSGRAKKPIKKEETDRGAALALLAEMSKYSKSELLNLADFYGIPIEIRPADAVRDVLGKILKYIQDNPSVQDRLVVVNESYSIDDAPPLAKALAILMSQK